MLQVFKIMKGFDQVQLNALKVNTDQRTRGHKFKLLKDFHKFSATKNSFSARSVDKWNNLPQTCVNSENVNSFKNNLNAAWKTKDNKFYYKF